MIEKIQQTVGRRVCIVGQGTASPVHLHPRIERITETMIIVEGGRRYRRDQGNHSIPYSAYGGTYISATCQRSK